MNLLNEYARRHGLDFLLPANDGVLFLQNKQNQPSIVCLTSQNPRNLWTCHRCAEDNPGMVVELISPDKITGYNHWQHHHIRADENLLPHLKRFCDEGHTPFVAKHYKELELWLWKFFVQHTQLQKNRRWTIFQKTQGHGIVSIDSYGSQTANEELSIRNQMFYCAMNYANWFRIFSNMNYQLLHGRHYLLYS